MDGRRGRTSGEVSTKATVDPNAALIITPGVVPGARRTAALVDEVSTKAGFGRAAMALAIFGRAVEALLSLGSTGEQQQESGCGDKLKVGAETGRHGFLHRNEVAVLQQVRSEQLSVFQRHGTAEGPLVGTKD